MTKKSILAATGVFYLFLTVVLLFTTAYNTVMETRRNTKKIDVIVDYLQQPMTTLRPQAQ